MRQTYWIRDGAVILIGLCAMIIVSATERKLDKQDEATAHDRLRVHCIDRPHDAMCMQIAGVN